MRGLLRTAPRCCADVCRAAKVSCAGAAGAQAFSAERMPLFCDVALPVPLDRTFTYAVGEEQRPAVGGRVVGPVQALRVQHGGRDAEHEGGDEEGVLHRHAGNLCWMATTERSRRVSGE